MTFPTSGTVHHLLALARRRAKTLTYAGCSLVLVAGVLVLATQSPTSHHEGGVAVVSLTAPQLPRLTDETPPAVTSLTPIYTSACGGSSDKVLVVSLSQQHLWACDDGVVVQESAVTTGMTAAAHGVDDATPVGTWHIYAKQTNTTLRGCDANGCWNDPVQYWMPYDGAVGFHDATWQTFPFGSSQYQTDGSHGCVHLPTSIAAWVYNWAPIGTTVTVRS